MNLWRISCFFGLLLLPSISAPSNTPINLAFSSFIGGKGVDWAFDTCLDDSAYIYVVGITGSDEFPLAPADSCSGESCYDLFLARINRADFSLDYVSRFGGAGRELLTAFTRDKDGFFYIVGTTESIDFPTQGGPQTEFAGGSNDGFILKVQPDGATIVWSSYLGGSGSDYLLGVTINESDGSVFVCGSTESSDFPLAKELSTTLSGPSDAFVTAISADGSTLEFSTYIGGSAEDTARTMSYSAGGAVYVAGVTLSSNFVTAQTFGPTDGSSADGYALRIDDSTFTITHSMRLGGSEIDAFFSSAVDAAGQVCLSGVSHSEGLPTVNAYQSFHAGGGDMYLTMLSPDLSTIVYGGYFGGSGIEVARDISLDSSGYVYITGEETSADLPLWRAYQGSLNGTSDAVAVKLNLQAPMLSYSSYCGGWHYQGTLGGGLSADGLYCVVGTTKSSDYPQVNSFQPTLAGGVFDGFVSCFTSAGGTESCCRVAGDVSHDGALTISDATTLIAHIFSGGPAPVCSSEADIDSSGSVTIGDVTHLIAYIFAGGPAPVCGPAGMDRGM